MDIFNKRKVEEQVQTIEEQAKTIDRLRGDLNELHLRLNGERVCGSYCAACKHGSATHYSNVLGGAHTSYACLLNCHCKDFERDTQAAND